jgi:ribosomal protein L37E
MNIGGLGARLALLRNQKSTKSCERCGLHYVFEENELCPHCGALDEVGLRELSRKVERNYQGRRNLGRLFFIAALVIGLVMLISSGI